MPNNIEEEYIRKHPVKAISKAIADQIALTARNFVQTTYQESIHYLSSLNQALTNYSLTQKKVAENNSKAIIDLNKNLRNPKSLATICLGAGVVGGAVMATAIQYFLYTQPTEKSNKRQIEYLQEENLNLNRENMMMRKEFEENPQEYQKKQEPLPESKKPQYQHQEPKDEIFEIPEKKDLEVNETLFFKLI